MILEKNVVNDESYILIGTSTNNLCPFCKKVSYAWYKSKDRKIDVYFCPNCQRGYHFEGRFKCRDLPYDFLVVEFNSLREDIDED